jgi:hypothetical protein
LFAFSRHSREAIHKGNIEIHDWPLLRCKRRQGHEGQYAVDHLVRLCLEMAELSEQPDKGINSFRVSV